MEENKTLADKIAKVTSAVIDTAEYELVDNFSIFKRRGFWLYFFAILAGFFTLVKIPILTIVCLFIIIIIQSKHDYADGEVTNYIRRKKGIPSKGEIRRMKNYNTTNKLQ